MMLLKVIDGLFVGTRYGVWLLGVLGIIGSVILAVANVGAGISAMLVCVGGASVIYCCSIAADAAKSNQESS